MHCSHSEHNHLNEHLTHLIAHVQVVHYHTQLAHWHISGNVFPSWHEMFGEYYEQLAEMIDTLAEHLRYHHGKLPTTLTRAITAIHEECFPDANKDVILHHITHVTKHLLTKYEEFMDFCAQHNKQTTLDILIGHARALEKIIWFYHSSADCCAKCDCQERKTTSCI
jgi:starvation-inducible DNA-binding protein